MVVLGIDPGTAIVGYAVLKKTEDGNTELLKSGAIRPSSKEKEGRLLEIARGIRGLIDIHRPDLIALEKIFFSKNIKTALSVAEARGVLLLTAKERSIRVSEYTPGEVKVAVTGYGKADKRQVKEMVKTILKLAEAPRLDDIADAMAIALTAIHTKSF